MGCSPLIRHVAMTAPEAWRAAPSSYTSMQAVAHLAIRDLTHREVKATSSTKCLADSPRWPNRVHPPTPNCRYTARQDMPRTVQWWNCGRSRRPETSTKKKREKRRREAEGEEGGFIVAAARASSRLPWKHVMWQTTDNEGKKV